MRIKIFIIIFFLVPASLFAQPKAKRSSIRNVLMLIDKEDYTAAAPILEELLMKYPDDPFLHLQAGICYLNIDYKEDEAIRHLEIAEKSYPFGKKNNKNTKNAIEARYYLGQARHLAYQFDQAINTFNSLKSQIEKLSVKDKELLKKIDREIRYSENAKELTAHPVKFRITNLGSAVNSEYDEHSPVVTADESMIIFTSNRPGTGNHASPDGLYNEDIYFSEWREGKWLPAMNIGKKINTAANDATVSLSADGRELLVYRNDGVSGDLYISKFGNDGWSKPEKLPKPINSVYNETHGSITDGGNTVYFASDRPGGLGGKDIYVSRKLPTGEWGKPLNLGPAINTSEDEDSPFIHSDGKTLYFASEGHNSMGGFDVFYSTMNDSGQWAEPVNVGYPINTPDDDLFYIPTADGQRVYYASKRKGGFGRSDIYIIEFPETDVRSLAVVAGYVFTEEGEPASDAVIRIEKKISGEVAGIYRPNPQTGKYIIILPTEEEYNMYIEMPGYKTVKQDLTVPVRGEFVSQKKVLFIDPVVLEKE
jgi:hypothetical protein